MTSRKDHMSNLEQRVKRLELLHGIHQAPEQGRLGDLVDELIDYNNLEGLTYINCTHMYRLAKKAMEFLSTDGGRFTFEGGDTTNNEINVLKDALRSTNAELVELKAWREGRKGVEDYYAVKEENRKLREHFRRLGLEVPNVA